MCIYIAVQFRIVAIDHLLKPIDKEVSFKYSNQSRSLGVVRKTSWLNVKVGVV